MSSAPKTDSKQLSPPVDGECGKKIYVVQGQKFEVNKNYNVFKVVGCGAYGIVCAATDSTTNEKVAVKKIARVFDDLVDGKRILREFKVLSVVHHNNLVRLREFLRPVKKELFEDVYVVTDLYDSDLHRIIKSQQKLTDEHCQYFMVQAFRGLHYLHSAKIMHRDLKPSNMLVDANCELAICDFGLARGEDNTEMTEYVVTRWYRPPELLALSTQYTGAVDIWSMGLIFAEMLVGRTLLPGKDYIGQLVMVIDLLGTPEDSDIEYLSEQAKRFICAQPQKARRNFQELFPKATSEAADLLSKILVFHPAKRLTAKQVLEHNYFHRLRDPAEEAQAGFTFEWKDRELTEPELREQLWDEITKRSRPNEPDQSLSSQEPS
jgi:mitogen-activated protein kinase 1/3